MQFLFAKSVVFFLVLTTSRCAPGRLGTIDRYNPNFSLTDYGDAIMIYTIGTTESDGTTESGGTTEDNTWEYGEYEEDVTDAPTNEIHLETPVPYIVQHAGQDDTTKGQTDCSDFVVDVEGPSTSLAPYIAAE
ncbi:uncharacterized protein LOC100163120 [Acyrthosiphon pisum]|uniref:Uncharacterized protein n=1 Tax=Acyrthosiphon pisum TaxID=7029 RepID=A0A8R2A7V9_ACYPI|nr:uncharacterized protein LOC100163120 [Acyrthosiphon pisum]|eukprot:XP_001948535.1 PREDICTED: uncharacterized protein LOC100163120 [Acyrthosiphon pisum]